jgi:5-methylcytosine-specific restriction endonuclease McrA
MKVFVLSHEGKPLMPTTPRRARLWLKAKRARLVRSEPFTIQLRFATQEFVQKAVVGVDTGSKQVGIAAITNGLVVFQAEMHLRDDITDKMTQRRRFRRTRRGHKTRYRQARFDNRRRPAGWLPPSLHSKSEATVKAVRFIASFLPVGRIHVEVGSFDTQKMQNPEIAGLEYCQGELAGYLLREHLLEKFQRTCVYCGAQGTPLEVEHIVPKSRGGSNRTTNLTLACHPCNKKKGQQTAEEFGFPDVQAKARKSLKDTSHVSSLKTRVVQQLRDLFGEANVLVTFGYQTKYKRIQVLDLPKSHVNDAVAIACEIGEVVRPLEMVHQVRCLSRGNYQRFNGLHSEHKCWAPRKVRGFKLYEIVRAKGQMGYIAGRREKGAFVIKDLPSGKKLLEVTPRKLVRVARPTQGWMIARLPVPESISKVGGASSLTEPRGTRAARFMEARAYLRVGPYRVNFDATGATIEIEREGKTLYYRIEAPSATNASDFIRGHREVVIAMANDRPEDLETYRVERQTEDEHTGTVGD